MGVIVLAVVKGNAPSINDGLAQCLTEKGTKMYGAWWCPHCQAQKKVFGNAFKYVDYVECSDAAKNMTKQCVDAGITGYPTWVFADGAKLSGEQDFDTLADKTGCELPPVE